MGQTSIELLISKNTVTHSNSIYSWISRFWTSLFLVFSKRDLFGRQSIRIIQTDIRSLWIVINYWNFPTFMKSFYCPFLKHLIWEGMSFVSRWIVCYYSVQNAAKQLVRPWYCLWQTGMLTQVGRNNDDKVCEGCWYDKAR